MEDLNTLAADCVVICCCCHCLILQILIFTLLRLPAKLAKRITEFARRKRNRRRRRRRSGEIGYCPYINEIVRLEGEEFCVRVKTERRARFVNDDEEIEKRGWGEKCTEEVEKVMMELYDQGNFGFGSFWGRGREGQESGCSVAAINVSTLNRIRDNEEDGDGQFVKYQIIQMPAASFRNTK